MGCVESPGLEGEESVRRVKEGGSILPGEERVAGGASEEAGFEARPSLESSYPGKPIVALIPVEESWSRPREERVGSRVESESTMLDSSWGRASWSERDREGSMAGSGCSGEDGSCEAQWGLGEEGRTHERFSNGERKGAFPDRSGVPSVALGGEGERTSLSNASHFSY